jgi:uncharacterized membrane protein YfcA
MESLQGVLGAPLGLLVGLVLGLLGGGGSVLTVPLFVYVLGIEVRPAIASSLAVVGLVALFGAWRHSRSGHVDVRTALVFGGFAMVGALAGARAAAWITPQTQLALFSGVLLTAAGFMYRGRPEHIEPRARRSIVVVGAAAIGVGALTGLVGVGGGFVIVPTLVLLLGLDVKRAIGTSLVVIAMNAASGFVGYVTEVHVPWNLLVGFTLFALVGIWLGSRWAERLHGATLRRAFAGFLALTACAMLAQNLL